jgi:1-acyl-sn-glycerol-3-phosphate acyltransferase
MKIIKNIIARVLAIWALLIFSSTMFIFLWFYLLCFFMQDPFKTRYHRRISQMWMGLFLTLSGCRFRVKGKEVFKGMPNAIVVCNHNSLIDIPVSTPFYQELIRPLLKKVLYMFLYLGGFINLPL